MSLLLFVAGNDTDRHHALGDALKARTGLPCRVINVSDFFALEQLSPNTSALVFVDCAAMGPPEQCRLATLRQTLKNDRYQFVCFNVVAENRLELKAFQKGAKGILYSHQPVDLHVRAAVAVLSGELWFPRNILEKIVLTNHTPPNRTAKKKNNLTRREKEILNMLVSGISNQKIAAQLCISPHTVRTHIQNLFKKIKVSNRFQAIQWLSNNQ